MVRDGEGAATRKAVLTLRVSGSPGLRLWDVSLQCASGGTVSEGRLAGSAAVRISFLGWQEAGRVQSSQSKLLFRRERLAMLGQPKAPSRHKISS